MVALDRFFDVYDRICPRWFSDVFAGVVLIVLPVLYFAF